MTEQTGSCANLRGCSTPPQKVSFYFAYQFDLSPLGTWLPLSAHHKMLMSCNGPNPSAECSYLRITKQHQEHGLGMSGESLPVVCNQTLTSAPLFQQSEYLKAPLHPSLLKPQTFAKAPICILNYACVKKKKNSSLPYSSSGPTYNLWSVL